jgi:hypothetical protein
LSTAKLWLPALADSPLYGIREAHGFLGRAIAVIGDLWTWEELKAGLDFALARDPKGFQRIGDTSLYAVQVTTMPPHAIFFTVDDVARQVCLEDIF